MSLEEILQTYFGCKKPFLNNRRVTDGGEIISMTKNGYKAYDRLVSLLYALESLDVGIDANEVIETLDNIADGIGI